jgi:hypothetical protein
MGGGVELLEPAVESLGEERLLQALMKLFGAVHALVEVGLLVEVEAEVADVPGA